MLPNTYRIPVVLAAFLALAAPAIAGDKSTRTNADSVKKILVRFQKGSPGWTIRMKSLVELAKAGPAAVPGLVGGLKSESPSIREFAAQALAMFAEPSARPALERALKDPKATVRIYAIRALLNLGPLMPAERYEKMTSDPDRNVRATVRSALVCTDKPDPETLRKAWAGYDLSKMSTAGVGKPAPDFTLTSHTGKTYRLSDFRSKTIVLRYIKLDY